MKSSVFKMTWRSIRTFFGRYIALLLIVMLSVGFFAGLKITKDAMADTCDDFLTKQAFYDFRIFSTLGFTEDDVREFAQMSEIECAEGTISVDVLMNYNGSNLPFKLFAMPEQINIPSLTSGRMPMADNECLADNEVFDENDIGKVISVSPDNDEEITDQLEETSYTIVGLVDSPLYLNKDRGTTGIGSGALYGFLYLPSENFTSEVYTEINLKLHDTAKIYSDEYDTLIAGSDNEIAELCEELANKRYEELIAESGLTPWYAAQYGINKPETYVLTRSDNIGYVSFENDTSIVSGVANIFPIFFIMIAMLVCSTTMTRMVDEERTQIGVLKALGFSNSTITAKYLLYAGSASFIGWAIGFFLGTWGLPQVFWYAYSSLYDFSPLSYIFVPDLALLTLGVALIGTLVSTLFSCRKELRNVPAKLIRPRTAKKGKRILLERITPVWKKLSFLQKITLRNMFRYKRRLIMMLVGISCCAGLVVTAFGVRDSMIDIGSLQFEEVQKYDMEITFEFGEAKTVCSKIEKIDEVTGYYIASVHRVDLFGEDTMNSVNLVSFEDICKLSDFWDFHCGDETVAFPGKGEAIVNTRVAEKLSLEIGDVFEIRDADMRISTVMVSGIFDNYVNNYVVISKDTYADSFGRWEANTALLSINGNTEATAKVLTDIAEVSSVLQLSSTKTTVDNALSCLDYIIWLIVLFSGALAFIVIFNLTNINIAERSREIATVQVLGFYPKETASYVLRENLILSVLASFIGLPLGTLFHRIVMSMIIIDSFAFDIHITPVSYVMAFICTVLFAVVVNLFMKRQISKIHMAESLKAVE